MYIKLKPNCIYKISRIVVIFKLIFDFESRRIILINVIMINTDVPTNLDSPIKCSI